MAIKPFKTQEANLQISTLPLDPQEAQAEALHNLTDAHTDNATLTLSVASPKFILIGNTAVALEDRLNNLVGIPNGLTKPIYPRSGFMYANKDLVDRQSPARKGGRAEQVMMVLASQGGGMFPGNMHSEVTSQPQFNPNPSPAKKSWFRRNKTE